MELVAITKDLPQSLHTYRWVPSLRYRYEQHEYTHKEDIHDHLQTVLLLQNPQYLKTSQM
jgi:hypothetical protein